MPPITPLLYSPLLPISSTPTTPTPSNCNLFLYPVPSTLLWSTFNDPNLKTPHSKNGLRNILTSLPVTATVIIAAELNADVKVVRKIRSISDEEVGRLESEIKIVNKLEDEIFDKIDVGEGIKNHRWGGSCTYQDLDLSTLPTTINPVVSFGLSRHLSGLTRLCDEVIMRIDNMGKEDFGSNWMGYVKALEVRSRVEYALGKGGWNSIDKAFARSEDVDDQHMGNNVWDEHGDAVPMEWEGIGESWEGGRMGMEIWALKANMKGMILGGRGGEWGVRALVTGIRVYEYCLGFIDGNDGEGEEGDLMDFKRRRMKVEGWSERFVQDVVSAMKETIDVYGSSTNVEEGEGVDISSEERREMAKTMGEMLEWGRERMEEIEGGCKRDGRLREVGEGWWNKGEEGYRERKINYSVRIAGYWNEAGLGRRAGRELVDLGRIRMQGKEFKEAARVLHPLVGCYMKDGWVELGRVLVGMLWRCYGEIGDEVMRLRACVEGVRAGGGWDEKVWDMRSVKDVEGTKFDAGSCFDVEVERGGRGRVGEKAEVKVRVRWWGKIDIKVGVEVGLVGWEDVEKRFREVGVGSVGGSKIVLEGGEVTLKKGVNLIPVPWVPKHLGHYVFSKVSLRMGGILFEQDEVEERMEGRTWSEARNVLADFEVGEGESMVEIKVEGKEIFFGQEEAATVSIKTNGDEVEEGVVKIRGGRVVFEDEGEGGFVRGKTEGGEEVRLRMFVEGETDEDSLDSASDEDIEEVRLGLGKVAPGEEISFDIKVGGEGFKKKRATRRVEATVSGSFRSHPDNDTFKFAKIGSMVLTRCRGFVSVDEKVNESSASITLLANVTRRVRVTGYRVIYEGVDVTGAVSAPRAGDEWVSTGEFYTVAFFGDFKGGFGGLVGDSGKRGGSRILIEFVDGGQGDYKQAVPVKLDRGKSGADEVVREAKLQSDEVTINGVVGIHADGEEGETYKVDFDKSVWAVEGKVKGKVGKDGRASIKLVPLKVGRIEVFPTFIFEDGQGQVKGIAKVSEGKVFTSQPRGVYRVELSHSF